MDLLIKDLNSGFLPKNYRKTTFHSLPSNMQEDLNESLSNVDNIIKGVFVNSNKQLFNSFVGILKSHLSWYDLGGLKEPESEFTSVLSKFTHYYFCPDGISVQVRSSSPILSYSYSVGESVLRVYELDGANKSKDLGVILLSDSTVKELTHLQQQVMIRTLNGPLCVFYGEDKKKRIYLKR